MRTEYFAVIVAAGLFVAAAAAAQDKTDFSGRWVVGGAAAGGARGPGAAGAGAGGAVAGAAGAGAAEGRGGAGGGGAGQRGGGARGGRGDLGSGWGTDITIAQDASKLTLTYAFFGRGDMQPPIKFVFNLDGSEAKNTVMMGRGMQEQLSKTTWDGGKLVIATVQNAPNPAGTGADVKTETKQVLSLESPTVLLVETTRAGVMGGAPSTTQTRYTKS